MPDALRSQRPLLTPDLLLVGPPTLAAIASDCGLLSSAVAPLRALDRPLPGAEQLDGADDPVERPQRFTAQEPETTPLYTVPSPRSRPARHSAQV